jgi:hypothetical protein
MDQAPRRQTLAWIGLALGGLAAAGIAVCVIVAGPIPRRAPTKSDGLTALGLWAGWIGIAVLLLSGFACSCASLLSGRKQGRPLGVPLLGVMLNAAPLPLGILYADLSTRGYL